MDGIEFSKEPTLEIISFFNGLISEIEYYTDCFKDTDIKAEDEEYYEIVENLLREIIDIGLAKQPHPGISDLIRRANQHTDKPTFRRLVKKVWRQWFSDFDFDVINEDGYLQHLLPNEQIYDETVEVYSLFPIFSFNDDYCKMLIDVLEKKFKQFSTCYEQLKTVYSDVGSASQRKHQYKRDSEWYDQSQSPTGLSLGQRSPKLAAQYTEYLYVEERRLVFDQLPERNHPKSGEGHIEGSLREITRFDDISSIQMTPNKIQNGRNPLTSVEKGQGFISEDIDFSMKRKLDDSSVIFNDLHDRIHFDTREGENGHHHASEHKPREARPSHDNSSIDKIDLAVEEQTPRLPSNQDLPSGAHDSNQQFQSVKINTLKEEMLSRLNEFTFKDSSRRRDQCSGESTERAAPQVQPVTFKPNFVIHTRDFLVDDSPKEDPIQKKSDGFISLLFFLDKFVSDVQTRRGFDSILLRSSEFDAHKLISQHERGDRPASRKVAKLLESNHSFALQFSNKRLLRSMFKAWVFSIVEKTEEDQYQYFSPPNLKDQKKAIDNQEVWEWDSAGVATHSNKSKPKEILDSKQKPALSIGHSDKSKKGVQISSSRNLLHHSNDILQSKPTPVSSSSVVGRIGSQGGRNQTDSNDKSSSYITKELDFTKPQINEFKFVSNPSHKHLPQVNWETLLKQNHQSQSNVPTKKKQFDQAAENDQREQPTPAFQRGLTQDSKEQMKDISDFTALSKNSEAEQTRRIMLKIVLKRTVKRFARLTEAYYQKLARFARSITKPDPKQQNVLLQTIQEDDFESFEPREKLEFHHESFPLDLDFRTPLFDRRIEKNSSRPSITFGPQNNRLISDRKGKEMINTNRLSDSREKDTSRSASRGSLNNKSTERMREMDYINQRIKLSIAKTAAKYSAGKTPPKAPPPIIYNYERSTKPTTALKSNEKRSDSKGRSRSQLKKKPFVTGVPHSRSRSSSPVNSAAFLRKPSSLAAAQMKADVKRSKRAADDKKNKYRSILDGKVVKEKVGLTPQKPVNPLEVKKPSRYEVILRNFEHQDQDRRLSKEKVERSKSPLDSRRKVVPVHLIHRDLTEKENRRPSSIIPGDREKLLQPSRSQSKLRKR